MSSGIGDLLYVRRNRARDAYERRVAQGSAPSCPPWCRSDEPTVDGVGMWHRSDSIIVSTLDGDEVYVGVEQLCYPDADPETGVRVGPAGEVPILRLDERQTAALIGALEANLATLRAAGVVAA